MKTYNRALDYLAIAMDQHMKGRVVTAAAAFTKAMASTDVQSALAILEASNKQAFAAKQEAVKAASKTKVSVEAKTEILQLAKLFGDNTELNATAIAAEFEPEGEPPVVEDEAVEEEDKDEGNPFTAALTAMKAKK